MAEHARTRCRDAAVTLLRAALLPEVKVDAGRPLSRPIQPAEMPRVVVYTDEESGEYTSGTLGARRIERTCELKIHAYVSDRADLDGAMDALALEIEQAIEADPLLDGNAADVRYVRTTKASDAEAEKPTGELVVEFACDYDTREGLPGAHLD